MVRLTPVKQYEMNGKFVRYYISISEASRQTNISTSSIFATCGGLINYSSGGYRWTYAEKSRTMKSVAKQKCTPVNQIDIHGNILRTFSSISKAAKTLGLQRSSICNVCKGNFESTQGCFFKYIYDEDKSRTHRINKEVNQLTLKGEFINRFDSVAEASKTLYIKRAGISRSCRLLCPYRNFRFEYR